LGTIQDGSARLFDSGPKFYAKCFGAYSSILNSPISTSIDFPGVHNISAAKTFSLERIQTNKWSAHLVEFGSPE